MKNILDKIAKTVHDRDLKEITLSEFETRIKIIMDDYAQNYNKNVDELYDDLLEENEDKIVYNDQDNEYKTFKDVLDEIIDGRYSMYYKGSLNYEPYKIDVLKDWSWYFNINGYKVITIDEFLKGKNKGA